MNTKGTEFSLFQGAPSIHVDNNQQRIEEEEAFRDQIRRNAELNNELQGAFDDLDDDDNEVDDTVDSTIGNSYHNKNQQYQHQQPFSLRDQETHLNNMLDSKTQELGYITSQLTTERHQVKANTDEYEKRLAIAEAEKERALMTRDQTHELLVEHKGKLIDREEANEKLRSKIKSLESENSNLVGELESTKLMLSDIQIKYNMVEKNVMFTADRNTDNILKQAQERHSAQIVMMQQQIDGFKSKFDDLEHEHKNLQIRYKEMQRSRESMLIEKSETINQLNKNLEDAQHQCQQLLSRPNLSQENRQLQNLVRSMEFQKDETNRTINKLQERLQEQTSEMELMDTIVQECGGNNISFSESTKFIHRDPLKNFNSSTPMAPEARLARVKEELCKSLNNIKNKREEIKIIEKQLCEKDEEIKMLKSDENKALVQMNHYRDEMIRLESKTKILEKELDKMRQELVQKSATIGQNCVTDEQYEEKLQILESQKKVLENELNSIKSDYERISMKNGELVEIETEWRRKVKDLEGDLKNYQENSEVLEKIQALEEELRKYRVSEQHQAHSDKTLENITNTCEKCGEHLNELEKLEIAILQLHNSNTDNLKELNRVQRELADAHRMNECLEEKLNLKHMRDQEIEKLKQKAEEFEGYMKANTRSGSVASSSSSNASHPKSDASTETSELNSESKKNLQQAETKVRDEMAKIFAAESKSLEKRFNEQVEQMHNRIILITEELEEKSHELGVRTEQVQLLKFTVLQEREDSEKSQHEREGEFKQVIEEYRTELANNQQIIQNLKSQLDKQKQLIEEERLSIERLKSQIEDERKLLVKKEDETLQTLKKLQLESTRIIEELNEKYLSAKKTAMNYKQFADDKEKHFRSECQRHRNIYLELAEKVEKRCKESLVEKEKTCLEKIKKLESEFDFKIDVYKDMLEKKK